MEFQIAETYPPDRESQQPELCIYHHDGGVDIPALLYREDDELKIELFARSGGVEWTFPVAEFMSTIARAAERFDSN